MKRFLALSALFLSMSASAAVVDLGTWEGRNTDGYTFREIMISNVGQVEQRINNFSNVYTFELKAPARVFISYNAVALDVTTFQNGTLLSRNTTLEKQSSDGTWKTIANPASQLEHVSNGMWNVFDVRKPDGTFYPSNPNQIDTMGKYRLSLAAQAAEGQYLSSYLGVTAYWALNANAPITAPVPEPETYALMGMGLLGLMAARRRKMK